MDKALTTQVLGYVETTGKIAAAASDLVAQQEKQAAEVTSAIPEALKAMVSVQLFDPEKESKLAEETLNQHPGTLRVIRRICQKLAAERTAHAAQITELQQKVAMLQQGRGVPEKSASAVGRTNPNYIGERGAPSAADQAFLSKLGLTS